MIIKLQNNIIGSILNAYQQDLIVLIGYTIKTLIFSDFFYTSMANEIHLSVNLYNSDNYLLRRNRQIAIILEVFHKFWF